MTRRRALGASLLALLAVGEARGGEDGSCEPPQGNFLERLHPVGGWNPYGGGLFHWWKRHCFPRCGGRDDYCRKPFPAVCWPPYPPYYVWAPPQADHLPGEGAGH